jgi:lipopolysaccharide biosynthesis glycosyltransferase
MNNKIYVVFVTDQQYIQHLGVALTSLLENTLRKKDIVTYIINDGILQIDQLKIMSIVQRYESKVEFLNINPSRFNELWLRGHLSLATFFKISIPRILDSVSKVLYIDCDVIVKGDIAELYETDICEFLIGACVDPYLFEHSDKLGIPKKYKYFNSGVMLLNLEAMRKADTESKTINFLSNNQQFVRGADQDGLNKIMFDSWKEIPIKWNVLHYYFKYKKINKLKKLTSKKFVELNT